MALFDLADQALVREAVMAAAAASGDQRDLLEEMWQGAVVPSRKQLEKLCKTCEADDTPLRRLIDELSNAGRGLALSLDRDVLLKLAGSAEAADEWLSGDDWPTTSRAHEELLMRAFTARAASPSTETPLPSAIGDDRTSSHPAETLPPLSQMQSAFEDMEAAFDKMHRLLEDLGFPARSDDPPPLVSDDEKGAPLAEYSGTYDTRYGTSRDGVINNTGAPLLEQGARLTTKQRNRALASALRSRGKPASAATWERAKEMLAAGYSFEEAARLA